MSAMARRLDRVESVLATPMARPRIIFGKDSADAEAKLADLRKGGFDGPVMVIRGWIERKGQTMPSTLEKRMDRVEAAIGGADESRVICCSTDGDAERTWSEAKASGRSTPLCLVMNDGSCPPVRDMGKSVCEMLADIAARGRRIHDPRPESTDAGTAFHFWHPPRNYGRH